MLPYQRDIFVALDNIRRSGLGTASDRNILHAPERDEIVRGIINIRSDPLVREALSSSGEGKKTVIQVLAEKKLYAAAFMSEELGPLMSNDLILREVPDMPDKSERFCVASRMWVSVPYLWSTTIRMALIHTVNAGGIPDHIVSRDLLPFPFMWWSFAEPVNGGHYSIEGILISDEQDSVCMSVLGRSDNNVHISTYVVRYGSRYPQEYEGEEKINAGTFLAFAAFLQSSLGVREVSLPRPDRRRLKIDSSTSPTVRFIDLRRYDKAASGYSEGETQERDYRWLVSGHIRAQWHPSTRSHQLIWIAPYVKGPEGKPLKPAAYRVIR